MRWEEAESESHEVGVRYDGGACGIVVNRYGNGYWVGVLDHPYPLWCHAPVETDTYPGCGEAVTACGETVSCDCLPGGQDRPL